MIPGPAMLPQIVAHRGASGHAPETTLAAYRLALQMGVDFVELDVHMARGGEIVAIHDSLVDRTTNGRGSVAALTLAELKLLDAGGWFNKAFPDKARPEFAGLKIPTLQEIIDLVKVSKAGLYIEIKNPELYPPHLESSLLSIVRRNRFEMRVLFLSFNARSLEKIKTADSSIPAALLVDDATIDPIRAALAVHADELAIRHTLATRPIVDAAHDNGLSVAVWTVDEERALLGMIELRADRIITNYPGRLNRLLGR